MVPVAIVPVAKVAIKAATVIGKTLFGASTIVGAVTKYGITFYIFGKVCQGCIYIAADTEALFRALFGHNYTRDDITAYVARTVATMGDTAATVYAGSTLLFYLHPAVLGGVTVLALSLYYYAGREGAPQGVPIAVHYEMPGAKTM